MSRLIDWLVMHPEAFIVGFVVLAGIAVLYIDWISRDPGDL
jgi:uncharacterized membrane protein